MALQHDQKVNKARPFPTSYKIIVALLSRPILIICSNFIQILNLFYWANHCNPCSPCLSKYYFKLLLNSQCTSVTLLHSEQLFHQFILVQGQVQTRADIPVLLKYDFSVSFLPCRWMTRWSSSRGLHNTDGPSWQSGKLLALDEKTYFLNIVFMVSN